MDDEGKSAVHHVVAPTAFASFENFSLLEALYRNGASLDTKDSAGRSALFYAHQQLSGVMAAALIKLGSKVHTHRHERERREERKRQRVEKKQRIRDSYRFIDNKRQRNGPFKKDRD